MNVEAPIINPGNRAPARFDVAICGGGAVGLALAPACRPASVALVTRSVAAPVHDATGAFDQRVYALSPGNVEFLRQIGVWGALSTERVTPVHAMEIFGDRDGSELVFDAYRAGVQALAWTVEDGALQRALWQRASEQPHVRLFTSSEPLDLAVGERSARVTLPGGVQIEAGLIVGADGAHSAVRGLAGIPVRESAYGQTAVVANFACERDHANVALQWFQGGPVLALLPLPERRVSMIWSVPDRDARRLLALDGSTLAREVEAGSRHRLGGLRLLGAPASYPLRRLSARRLTADRIALVGDAARVIHPLAGQGLNLGLQDARALASVLAERAPAQSAGDAGLLRRYARRRAESALVMQAAVDGLFSLFGAPGEGLARVRNRGLNLVTRVPVLKNLLMRQAMS